MRLFLRWLLACLIAAAAGGLVWPAGEAWLHWDSGTAAAVAVGVSALVMVPLAWWAPRDRRRVAAGDRHFHINDGTVDAAENAQGNDHDKDGRIGRAISTYTALALEVHRAIEIPDSPTELPPLPRYVRRLHDGKLAEAVHAANEGKSRIVTLVGGSSTGKTRACWEAIRQLPEQWWLWHPIDPSRPEAAVDSISEVGPHTVIWLNEAQFYLLTADTELGERISAGLRTLLNDPSRAPVLVLATMWPQFWDVLTRRPPHAEVDPHAQARELLSGSEIAVPGGFSGIELANLRQADHLDPRLRIAADNARDGRVTQYLAGAPELLKRYQNALPATRAIIDVAIDARRLGHPVALDRSFIERAAPGYIVDDEWDQLHDAWLEVALTHACSPGNGVQGPLTRCRPRPGDPTSHLSYRLADYLEQVGRAERAAAFPPASFWSAVIETVTDSDVLREMGHQAKARGRYLRAAELYRKSADQGDAKAARGLARVLDQAGGHAAAESVARHAADRGDGGGALVALAVLHERQKDWKSATSLYQQAADAGNSTALWAIARLKERAGSKASAEATYEQIARSGNNASLRSLGRLRQKAGDREGANGLYQRAADRGDNNALRALARARESAGDVEGAASLYQRAFERGNLKARSALARLRVRSGDLKGAEELYSSATDDDPGAIFGLAQLKEMSNDQDAAVELFRKSAEGGHLKSFDRLARLLESRGNIDEAIACAGAALDRGYDKTIRSLADRQRRTGNLEVAERLYRRAADHGNPEGLVLLAGMRARAGDLDAARELYEHAASQGSNSALWELANIYESTFGQDAADSLFLQAADNGAPRALRSLARRKEGAGDPLAAESLAKAGAARGDISAVRCLAQLRHRAGNLSSAEALFRQAIDYGDPGAIAMYAKLRDDNGYHVEAEQIRRFGLTDDGMPARSLPGYL